MKLYAAENIANVRFEQNATKFNRVQFLDAEAFMACQLHEDSSSYQEEFTFKDGLVAVNHKLSLTADRNLAEVWLDTEFQRELLEKGVCAFVTLNDGRQLLVGYSERFGSQQPLRLSKVTLWSGRKLSDAPTLTLELESFDTSAAAESLNNK